MLFKKKQKMSENFSLIFWIDKIIVKNFTNLVLNDIMIMLIKFMIYMLLL